jgi:hypothetical protein
MPKSRTIMLQVLISGLFFLLIPNTFAGADSLGSFGVDSYIPLKFTDFRWTMRGNMNLNGANNSDKDYPDEYDGNFKEYGDAQTMGVGSALAYTYETLAKHFHTGISISGDFSHSGSGGKSNHGDATYNSPYYHNYDYNSMQRYNFGVSPYAEGDIYLAKEFFIFMSLSSTMGFDKFPEVNRQSRSGYVWRDTSNYIRESQSVENSEGDENRQNIRINLSVGPGWGRIYSGNYAATALYIIEELRNNELLTKEPSVGQMQNLTEIIYQRRLKHSIDSRIYSIETIEEIAGFLKAEGLMQGSETASTMTINDVWSYFPNNSRSFGQEFKIGFGLDYSYNRYSSYAEQNDFSLDIYYHRDSTDAVDTLHYFESNYQSTSLDKTISPATQIFFNYGYSKPINLRWQFDLATYGRYVLDQYYKTSLHDDRIGSPAFNNHDYISIKTKYSDTYYLSIAGTITYILNSRSSGYLRTSANTDHYHRTITRHSENGGVVSDTTYAGKAYDYQIFSFEMGGTYRISIPTTLNVSINYSRRTYDFHASINHYLF